MTQARGALPTPTMLDYERTLMLAIELSNTSWVLAAQIPGLPRVKAKQSIEPTAEALLAAIEGYRDRAEKAGRNVDGWSPSTRPAGRGFGWRAGWQGTALRRTSFSPPAFRSIAGRGGPNPTGSMPSSCCARCWPGFAASRVCARWCRSPPKPMKMSAGASGSGKNWWLSGSASSIGSMPCWRPWGCVTTTRSVGIGVSASTSCAQRSGIHFRRTPARE